MGRNKHFGILGVAVVGLLTLGACGSRPTTLPPTTLRPADSPKHEHVQAIAAQRMPDIQCGVAPFSRC
jgi:hypothetical protein